MCGSAADDPAMHDARCDACGHPIHWRACRAAGNGRLVDGCYCRRREPFFDDPYDHAFVPPANYGDRYWCRACGFSAALHPADGPQSTLAAEDA